MPSSAASRRPRQGYPVRQASQATPTHRKAPKRSRLSRTIAAVTRALVVFVVLLGVGLAVRSHFFVRPSAENLQKFLNTGTFFNGITIDGVNVAGMTLHEARQTFLPRIEEAANSINISVRYESSLWLLTAVEARTQKTKRPLRPSTKADRPSTPASPPILLHWPASWRLSARLSTRCRWNPLPNPIPTGRRRATGSPPLPIQKGRTAICWMNPPWPSRSSPAWKTANTRPC